MELRTERDKVAHLLRRFGLGASNEEIDYYGQGGLSAAIDKLLNFEQTDEGFDLPPESLGGKNAQIKVKALPTWWLLRLIVTRRPLQEKMTLFWHDHFATSAAKVDIGPAMYNQNEAIRSQCVGRFQDLLTSVSKDPAMLYWLDNQFNVKGKPNENFAREVMELFTLGIGHYTEKDIQESARAFTGWSYGAQRPNKKNPQADKPAARNTQFVMREELHDDGVKAFLGNRGNFDGDDVLGILAGNPQTALYITRKIWEWFVYPNPDAGLIDRFATNFRSKGLDIKTLLRSIMESNEFYSDRAYRSIVKNPVDFCVATLRQLGVGANLMDAMKAQDEKEIARASVPARVAANSTKAMGMELFFPPDVSGWDGGSAWISSATMVERIKWADRLFGSVATRGQISLRYPASSLFVEDSTPTGIVKRLIGVFDAPIPQAKVTQLVSAAQAASGGEITDRNANEVADAVSRLIFGSPEFQFM